MADIIPDTEIQFFRNIHIDPDHENTIYFTSESAKDTYFDNIPHIVARKCYYQRERRNYCRVEFPLSDLLNRQYMRFKNSQFENKWFYAFVDDVEYINNITTEVHYTLDPVMTWMGQFDLDECFIERQHTETDNIGDNLVPEKLDTSETVHNGTPTSSGHMHNWCYLVMSTPDNNNPPAGDTLGYYSGWSYQRFNTANDLTVYLEGLSAIQQELVQGIFYVPSDFISNTTTSPVTYNINISKPTTADFLDNYQPKNNKLYTYPYNYLYVVSTDGPQEELRYELFRGNDASFLLMGVTGEQAQVALLPQSYDGLPIFDSGGIRTMTDMDKILTITSFQMCSWTADTFKAFLAQQITNIPTLVTQVTKAGVYGALGMPAESVAQMALARPMLDKVTGAMTNHYFRPYEVKGDIAYQLATVGRYKDFYFYRDSVRGDVAKRIDDYFTMFGYAVNDVAKPNMCARPYYTYIKTIGCHVNTVFTGAEDVRFIEECFNNGMRLWNGANLGTTQDAYIGNYSTLDNSPTVSP